MAWFGIRTSIRNVGVGKYAAILVFLAVFFMLAGNVSASTSNSRIDVLLCNPNDQTSITLTQPPSDSVTHQPNVAVAGTVANATQVEILVDGHLDHTLPLSEMQQSFATSVHLTPGTHTITARAVPICNFSPASQSAVVTYQPSPTPSPPTPPIPAPSPSLPIPDRPLPGLGVMRTPGLITGDEVQTEVPEAELDGIEGLDGVLFEGEVLPWPMSYAFPVNPWLTFLRLVFFGIGLGLFFAPLFFARRLLHTATPYLWVVALLRITGLLLVLFALFGLGLL